MMIQSVREAIEPNRMPNELPSDCLRRLALEEPKQIGLLLRTRGIGPKGLSELLAFVGVVEEERQWVDNCVQFDK